jgi:hypothetical protein
MQTAKVVGAATAIACLQTGIGAARSKRLD